MAIKGKSRSRSGKTVTRGPKPVPVPVKKPLLARRGVWVSALAALAALAVAGVWYGLARQAAGNRQRLLQERMGSAVSQWQGVVDPALASVGTPLPPASFQVLTGLADDLELLRTEQGDPETIAANAEAAAGSARDARMTLDDIDLVEMVSGKGFSQEFVLYMLNSQAGMIESLRLYEQAARLTALAAETPEGERTGIVRTARELLQIASDSFARSYSDYVQAQSLAGVFVPTFEAPSAGS